MTELVLIRITGADKPGVTATISSILAQYEVTVLDIGQAEIHDSLSLGILMYFSESTKWGCQCLSLR